jgi:hypothetical protein
MLEYLIDVSENLPSTFLTSCMGSVMANSQISVLVIQARPSFCSSLLWTYALRSCRFERLVLQRERERQREGEREGERIPKFSPSNVHLILSYFPGNHIFFVFTTKTLRCDF